MNPANAASPGAGVRSRIAHIAHALVGVLAFALTPLLSWASGHILLNVEAVDTSSAQSQAARTRVNATGGKRLHLVQFKDVIKPENVGDLARDGLIIVNYIPDNAYLVWGDSSAIQRMQTRVTTTQANVQWDGAFKDEWKINPAVYGNGKTKGTPLAQRTPVTDLFVVQMVSDFSENAATMRDLASLGGSILADPGAIPGFMNRVVKLKPDALATFAARPDIVSIFPYVEPTRRDERQGLIMAGQLTGNGPTPGNYFTQLTNWGFTQTQFTTSGFAVDVTDDGAEINPAAGLPAANTVAGPVNTNHFVFYLNGDRPIGAANPIGTSRYVYKGLFGTVGTDGGLGNSGHGQLNMSIVGGYVPTGNVGGVDFGVLPHADASGYRFGLGIAPFVRLGNSVIFDPNYTNPNYNTLQSAAYGANARISTNSWGASTAGAYTSDSQTYDGLVRDAQSGTAGNQQMVILFSAGNDGGGLQTVGSPGTGKNVITVGASEGVQAFGGADGCGVTDAQADSANDIAFFSSRGPTTDGRKKPDIVAPGTHISGIAFVTPTSTGNATKVATYRGDGVCGGVPPSIPFPTGQNWYTASSGTSHSTPAVAGGAALIYQQFLNNPSYLSANRVPASGPPSPALVKAYLMNTTRYMNGLAANDDLWSVAQGMGMINLGTAFDGVARAIRDQVAADRFTASGQVRQFTGTTADASKPLRLTLAWTDAPGPTTGNAYVNNLDLVVVAGGNTYLGNNFLGQLSITGGSADPRNNVESVFLPAGITSFTVLVKGTNIPGTADPTVGGPNQDFALVAYNSGPLVASTTPVLNAGPLTVTTGNGIVEPLECNNFNATINNGGQGGATAISSVITSSTPGAVVFQNASAYPDIAANASGNNTTPFQLSTSASIACGTIINLTNTVTYTGGGSPVALPFTVRVGQPPNPNYVFTSSTGNTISAGGTLVAGSQQDDILADFTVPFAFSVYGTAIASGSTIRLGPNGNIQLVAAGGNTAFNNAALPASAFGTVPTLMPYWDDLDLRTSSGATYGIYSEVTGSAPTRTLKLEWRGQTFNNTPANGLPVNFAVYFHENSDDFEYVYNNSVGASGNAATIGVQASGSGTVFTQFSFNTAGSVPAGTKLSATRPPGICNTGAAQCAVVAPNITSANNTTFNIGSAGTFTFTATGAPAPGIAVTGSLPNGVTYNAATKTLSGTPAAGTAGVYPLTVAASNGVPPDANQNFTLTVSAAPPPGGKRRRIDFNNDSKDDLVWRNSGTAAAAVWLMNGMGTLAQAVVYGGGTYAVTNTGDLNGDSKTDLIFKMPGGPTAAWLMNGTAVASSAVLLSDPNWAVVRVADFDGDGKEDLLWRNTSTGQTAIWLMNGLTPTATVVIYSDPNWVATHAADFNGDGKADLVWRNTATGQTAIWLMNGTTPTATTIILGDANWAVTHTTDLNGDGKADLVWRNTSTGATALWLMNGTAMMSGATVLVSPPWYVTNVGDFDGDGKGDLVWRNTTTGQTAVWLMNGLTIASQAVILTDLNWTVTHVADTNGDGKSDLLWRNTSSGTALWLMNGTSASATSVIFGDPTWSLSPPDGF
ncbi:MAG: FG-GAP-like repeat-containing protein [Burkholderiales bacterium]